MKFLLLQIRATAVNVGQGHGKIVSISPHTYTLFAPNSYG